MAFDNSELALVGYGNGHAIYLYREDDDARATVAAAGYVNNLDDDVNLRAGDTIQVIGAGGHYVLRVDAVAGNGDVSTEAGAGETQWITVRIDDVSTAGSVFVAAPFDGLIGRFRSVLQGAISGANAAVGLELAGVDVTGAQVTVAQSGSAAGDVDEGTATAANAVTEGQAVEIDTDGASTGTVALVCMVEFIPA